MKLPVSTSWHNSLLDGPQGIFNQQEAQSRRKCFEASIETMLDGELFAEN